MLSTRNPAEPAINEPGLVTISITALQRVKVIEAVVEGHLNGVRAPEAPLRGFLGSPRALRSTRANSAEGKLVPVRYCKVAI